MSYFYHKITVKKPKKVYKCYLCGEDITGEHFKFFGKWKDCVQASRGHIKCHNEMDEYCSECGDRYDCQFDVNECFNEMMKERKGQNDE